MRIEQPSRRLASSIEPFAGQVYFAPECHANYAALGFSPSERTTGIVALPDGVAYFCSRGSILGQVPGEVVAAAFAVFKPAAVIPSVRYGWTLTDAATINQARTDGAVAQLTRILGERPEGLERANELMERAITPLQPAGKPLFAGLLALGLPDTPLGDAWRRADLLREYRGDAHIAAWTAAGFDATEIGLVSELFWGLAPRTYIRTRAWGEADLDAATIRLADKGFLAGQSLTEAGRDIRAGIEVATDVQCQPIIDALGGDLEELIDILQPWSDSIRAAGGYLASGPHDLARVMDD